MNLITLAALVTVYFLLILLAQWWAVHNIRRSLGQSVEIIREQRDQDLRWHRESLLTHIRAEQASRR